MVAKSTDVLHDQIGKLVVFRMCPASFNRIGVRSVGRKMKGLDPRMLRQELFDNLAAVNPCLVPDQCDWTGDVMQHRTEKSHNKVSVEVGVDRKHLKQETFALGFGSDCNRPNCRYFSTAIPRDKLGGLPARSQSSPSGWHHLETRLISVDQRCPFLLGFFLMSGSSFESHCATFSGSRSRATFSGRWNVQPSFDVTILKT